MRDWTSTIILGLLPLDGGLLGTDVDDLDWAFGSGRFAEHDTVCGGLLCAGRVLEDELVLAGVRPLRLPDGQHRVPLVLVDGDPVGDVIISLNHLTINFNKICLQT